MLVTKITTSKQQEYERPPTIMNQTEKEQQQHEGPTDTPRLDFSAIHHVGRTSELQELVDCFEHHCSIKKKKKKNHFDSADEEAGGDDTGEATSASATDSADETATATTTSRSAVAIVIEAPAGTGKSVLLDRFRVSIEEEKKNTIDGDDNTVKPLVCRGKFEERTAASEPFAAIVEAMNELCEQIMVSCSSSSASKDRNEQHDNDDNKVSPEREQRSMWTRRIKEVLGDETVFLQAMFPKMRCLFESLDEGDTEASTRGAEAAAARSSVNSSPSTLSELQRYHHAISDITIPENGAFPTNRASKTRLLTLEFDGFGNLAEKEWRFERFRIAFRGLIRIISTHAPLVLLLDDLHWVDPDSFQLVQTLLEDSYPQPRNFMLVAATRPIRNYPTVQEYFGSSKIATNYPTMTMRSLQLPNLQTRDVSCLLSHMLLQPKTTMTASQQVVSAVDNCGTLTDGKGSDDGDDEIKVLSELVYKKTKGNCFLVIQMLRILEQQHAFTFDQNQHCWTWNTLQVQSLLSTQISENVMEVVADSLQQVDVRQKQALVTAAVFGVSHFEVTTIVHAMTLLEEGPGNNDSITMLGSTATITAAEIGNPPPTTTAPCNKTKVQHDVARRDSDGSSAFLLMDESEAGDSSTVDPYQLRMRIREMNELLRDAARNGLVEETSPGHYKFAHDRVRDAASSLLPSRGSQAMQMIHLRIGRQLRSWMDQSSELGTSLAFDTEEALLLHATKQLNLGSALMTDSWEKLDLAEQNFHSAELAAKKSSFFPAIEYLEQGLQQLGDCPWKHHYDVAHKLSVALTRIQYSCGRLDDCLRTADDVLSHGRIFRHKRPVYHTKLLCLVQHGKQQEAQELALSILNELGHSFPRRGLLLHLLLRVRKNGRILEGMSNDDIVNLPKASDEKLNDTVEFMMRMAEMAFSGGDPLYFPIFAARSFEISLSSGYFPTSSVSLVSWAIMNARFGDYDEAFRFGTLALEVADKGFGRHNDTRARVAYWSTIYHWRLPLRTAISPFRAALNEFWEYGTLDYIHLDGRFFCRVLFACGEPLNELARESEKRSEFLLDYKQYTHWCINAPLFQAVSNFMGKSDNPLVLAGKYISQTDLDAWNAKPSSNVLALYQSQFHTMILAYYFGDLELAERLISQMKPTFEAMCDLLDLFRVFYTGLVYVGRYKTTRRRKYKRKAMVQYRQLNTWAEGGTVTCNHMCMLLKAGTQSATALSAGNKKGTGAVVAATHEEYDRAIKEAAAHGLLHHEALGNELAGSFFFDYSSKLGRSKSNGDGDPAAAALVARSYVVKALDLYQQWGAAAKVKEMRARFEPLLLLGETGHKSKGYAALSVAKESISIGDNSR